MSLIRTEKVSKKFGDNEVLKDISLSIEQGEVICIIGPSGAGKSTYLRSLNQLEKITSGKIFIEEELFLHRENDRTVERIAPDKQKKLLLDMGMVFQRFNLFPHRTVLDNVTLAPIRVKKMDKAAVEELARDLLTKVGLIDKVNEYPAKLSGGQQQRVAIARALAMQPKIMLFDEPTSALDVTVQKQILELLIELKQKEQLSFLLICHDLALVQAFCDKVLVLYHGKTVEYGTPDEIINHPKEDYTKRLIDSVL